MTCSETKTKKEYFERKFGVEGAAKMRELLMARGKEEGITLCVFVLSFVGFFWFLVSGLSALYMLLPLLWPHVLPAVILHPLVQALPNPEPRGWGCAQSNAWKSSCLFSRSP